MPASCDWQMTGHGCAARRISWLPVRRLRPAARGVPAVGLGLAPVLGYAMTALPQHKMTVDKYLARAEGRPGRFELYTGSVYAMTPERAGHAKVKYAVQTALLSAIRWAGLPCHMRPDGVTVRVTNE